MFVIKYLRYRPRSIYQYSKMVTRLSGQNLNLLGFFYPSIPKRLRYNENNTKYRSLF